MRRRPMLPDARRDVALEPAPARTWRGRKAALPQGVQRATANPAEIKQGGPAEVVIEHVDLGGVADQSVADSTTKLRFSSVAGPPKEPRGFEDLFDLLATDGEVTEIPISVTGVLTLTLEGEWESYRGCRSITITRTRNGATESKTFDLGPVASRYFD